MLLFLYGSLRDRRTLARRAGAPALPRRLRPARLAGFSRRPAAGGRFTTLVPARTATVEGVLLPLGFQSLRRLIAYEGRAWHLTKVHPIGPRGRVLAHAFIAPPRSRCTIHERG